MRKAATKKRTLQQPLQVLAYDAIKYNINTCRYKPGEYINEQNLAKDLKFGRTPVHQAINRLSLEGFVEIIPRKGVIVKPISLDEILSVSDLRIINETYCAQLASRRFTPKHAEELNSILNEQDAACDKRDVERLMLLDRSFHSKIASIAGNSVLAEILGNLHDRSLRHWFLSLTEHEHHRKVIAEHRQIVKAMDTGTEADVAKAVADHIGSFRENLLRRI